MAAAEAAEAVVGEVGEGDAAEEAEGCATYCPKYFHFMAWVKPRSTR